MSFDALEYSIESGRPVRLYLFQMGPIVWPYVAADRDLTYDGIEYKMMRGISDDGIRQSGQTSADILNVSLDVESTLVVLWRGCPPSERVSLTVRDLHYGDTEAIVRWVGFVKSVKPKGIDRAMVSCQNIAADLQSTGLRLCWSRNCPHVIYDAACKVSPLAYREEGSVIGINGQQITSGVLGLHGDGWYSGGYVEWPLGGGIYERRGIETQVGDTASLFGGTAGLVLGQALYVFPGCNRTQDHCINKFNNIGNNGGIAIMPGKSPFAGDPLF